MYCTKLTGPHGSTPYRGPVANGHYRAILLTSSLTTIPLGLQVVYKGRGLKTQPRGLGAKSPSPRKKGKTIKYNNNKTNTVDF